MKKNCWTMLFLLVITILSIIYWMKDDKNSDMTLYEINVNADNISITSFERSRIIDFKTDSETKVFKSILKESKNIPYIKLGETIEIKFNDNRPDTYNLTEYILDDDGNFKYDVRTVRTIEGSIDKGVYSFTLDENLSTYLSSDTKDYEEGAIIRGFKFICTWEDDIQEYFFLLKTDAMTD